MLKILGNYIVDSVNITELGPSVLNKFLVKTNKMVWETRPGQLKNEEPIRYVLPNSSPQPIYLSTYLRYH